jgi:hypothetical protein
VVLVVPSELIEGTGDGPLSLNEDETTEMSEATSSPSLRLPTRWPGLRELTKKSKVKAKSPKPKPEMSLEGVETPGDANYMGTTIDTADA